MSSAATTSIAEAMFDLGPVDGPLFCFGGPYSNLQATAAVLAEAKRRGFPPERIVCTGDVVAYCADPAATVKRVRDAGIHVVKGNCEESLAFEAADCGCGFAEGSPCAEWSKAWFAAAAAALDQDAKRWMASLPRSIRLILGGRRLAVIHGGDDNISRYIRRPRPIGRRRRRRRPRRRAVHANRRRPVVAQRRRRRHAGQRRHAARLVLDPGNRRRWRARDHPPARLRS
jgi:hypothetical protein